MRIPFAGQLMSILSYSFQGDTTERITAWEREIAMYERDSGKILGDEIKVGALLIRLPELQLKTHLWCVLVCHPHLTIIICCTAVWAQTCGLEHKTSFVIIVHLWFIRRPQLFVSPCWCVGGAVSHIFRTCATVTIFILCVLVNTLQYHDTVDFAQDSETENPQLVAEPGVGRNHGKTMGKS